MENSKPGKQLTVFASLGTELNLFGKTVPILVAVSTFKVWPMWSLT